jgi:hypothetical protein
MINESTEFEERSATRSKDLDQYLKSLKETTEQLSEVYQTLTASQSVVHLHPTVQPSTRDSERPQAASGAEQLTSKVGNFLVLRANAVKPSLRVSALLSMCVVSWVSPDSSSFRQNSSY